jgi:hypothetical protein
MFQITDKGITSDEGYIVHTLDREFLRYTDERGSVTLPYDVDAARDVMIIHISAADPLDGSEPMLRRKDDSSLLKERLSLAFGFVHTETEFD